MFYLEDEKTLVLTSENKKDILSLSLIHISRCIIRIEKYKSKYCQIKN